MFFYIFQNYYYFGLMMTENDYYYSNYFYIKGFDSNDCCDNVRDNESANYSGIRNNNPNNMVAKDSSMMDNSPSTKANSI